VLLTNHVLSGALIGALARRPLPAFAAGVVSHFVLDAVPHWGDWGSQRRFLRVAVPDGLVSLAVMGALTAASPPGRRAAMLAGMTGAALPDAEKPTNMWFGWSPFPAAVDRFHSRIQDESFRRAPVEGAAAAAFATAAFIAIRRARAVTAGTAGRPARRGRRG
jgi:hypothetical protein